jgi:putative flippase GtrA
MIFIKNKNKSFFDKYHKYIIVGLINVSLDFIIFKFVLHLSDKILLSSLVSGVVVVIVGFILHNKFTFYNQISKKNIIRYLSFVFLVILMSNTLALMITSDNYLFKAYQILLSSLINYASYKYWVFKI